MADEYRIVTAKLKAVKPRAILVDNWRGGEAWIPRSLIHGGDDLLKIEKALPGAEITFRLMEWKAEELGFA